MRDGRTKPTAKKIERQMRELKKAIDRYSKLPKFSVEAWKEKFLSTVLAPINIPGLALFEQKYRAVLEGW
jgi:hypothetical protein